jgi:hypothetical protein
MRPIKVIGVIVVILVLIVAIILYSQAMGRSEKELQVHGANHSGSDVTATITVNNLSVRASIVMLSNESFDDVKIVLHLGDRISVAVHGMIVNFEGSNVVRDTTDSISISVQSNGFVFVFLNDGLGLR